MDSSEGDVQYNACQTPSCFAIGVAWLLQIEDFDYSNPSHSVYAAYNCGVSTWGKRSDDRRISRLARSVPAILYIADLIAGNDAEDFRGLPIIVFRNNSSGRVVQLQIGIT